MQPVTRYAKSGDVHIAYQVFGDGPINLILAPFFVSNIEVYWEHPDVARWLFRLASFARVAMFDKRGHPYGWQDITNIDLTVHAHEFGRCGGARPKALKSAHPLLGGRIVGKGGKKDGDTAARSPSLINICKELCQILLCR